MIIAYFKNLLSARQNSDKEFYAIDIGDWNRSEAQRAFNDLKLDLDDDVFFFAFKNFSGFSLYLPFSLSFSYFSFYFFFSFSL
jgi:hypothetical protein